MIELVTQFRDSMVHALDEIVTRVLIQLKSCNAAANLYTS